MIAGLHMFTNLPGLRRFFGWIFVLLIAGNMQLQAQQFYLGQSANATIASFVYNSQQCNSFDFVITFSDVLNDYVNGLGLYLSVDSMTAPPNSVFMEGFAHINSGDLIPVSPQLQLGIHFTNFGSGWFSLRAIGTPQIAHQPYPCGFMVIETLQPCENIYLVRQTPDAQICFVETATDLEEASNELSLTMFPNPVSDKVFISVNGMQISPERIRMFESEGREVYDSGPILPSGGETVVDTRNLPRGTYVIKVYAGDKTGFSKLNVLR